LRVCLAARFAAFEKNVKNLEKRSSNGPRVKAARRRELLQIHHFSKRLILVVVDFANFAFSSWLLAC
jgi:hypothetical protein